MNKLKFAVVGVALAAAVVALVMQNQAQVRLRAENESLRSQLDQLTQSQADNETFSNQLAKVQAAADAQTTELLKLRGEVGMLRKQAVEMTGLQKQNQQLSAALATSRAAQLARPPPETAPKITPPDNTTTDPAAGPDLGSVQLVNQTPKQFDLGGGKTCILTPAIDADGNYHIKVLFEWQKSDVQTERQTAEIITSPGRAVRISVGDSSIGFTPTVSPAP